MEVPTDKNVMPDSSPAQAEPTAPVVAPSVPAAPASEPAANVPETPAAPAPAAPAATVEAPKPTEKMVPLTALEQERTWRKDWEQKYKDLAATTVPSNPDVRISQGLPDEDAVYRLAAEVDNLKNREAMRELETVYPQLADKRAEFEEFRKASEYSAVPIASAAKVFLAENGLLQQRVVRQGLEQPTGGTRTPPTLGMSKEDVKALRENQPRKYERMLRDGSLNPDLIK